MLTIRKYKCPQYRKRIKSTNGSTRHLNACTSLSLRIQLDHNSLILAEDNDASDYSMHHEEEEYPLGDKW